MYTRTYTEERHGILIPESYGGTALSDSALNEKSAPDDKGKNPWENVQNTVEEIPEKEECEPTFSQESKIQMPVFLSGIFKNGNFSLQKLGKEEILILATAAFLFLSKEGDKQLAIMLLLLLFLG